MKIVVVGGTGLIGSKVVGILSGRGYEALPASPATGVNSLTGEGLGQALAGAEVVVDTTNAPSFEASAVMEFFVTSTRTILEAGREAGVGHHVALSVVGTDRLGESGYFRAKLAQERLIEESSTPYSIVRATQFFEFLRGIADAATDGNEVRLPSALIQPVAADEVAVTVAEVAVGDPINGIIEVGGPEQFRLDEVIGRVLTAGADVRDVVTDPEARYFGARLGERTLVPGRSATLAQTTLEEWQAPTGAMS
jgi:uncharacterized protein YbjT (DUF2867 family)